MNANPADIRGKVQYRVHTACGKFMHRIPVISYRIRDAMFHRGTADVRGAIHAKIIAKLNTHERTKNKV